MCIANWLTCMALAASHTGAYASSADVEAREAEMFGSSVSDDARPANQEQPAAQTPQVGTTSLGERAPVPAAADGDDTAELPGQAPRRGQSLGDLTAAIGERLARNNDVLTIGGFFFLRDEWDILAAGRWQDWPLTSPNLLDLYFDARPSERVRGYFRGRITYNPAITTSTINPFTLQPQSQTSLLLDQFWLKFDILRTVYVTFGRQPIRWGVGRFWNPTDFLNKQHRDPLAIFDERVGVTLLKLHMPVEARGWNFYGALDMSNVTTADFLGGALRSELLFDQTEVSATLAKKKGGPLQLGLDVSSGVGIFDLKFEGALVHGVAQQFFSGPANLAAGVLPHVSYDPSGWFTQLVAGGEVTLRYHDDDQVIVGVEYFYNQLGYASADYYLAAVQDFAERGLAPPFLYLGRHYAAAYAVFAKPGAWDNTTFIGSFIGNLTDGSYILRIDHQVRILTFMDLNFYAAYHFGNEGELRLAINIPAGIYPGLANGYARAAPAVDLGGGLRLYF